VILPLLLALTVNGAQPPERSPYPSDVPMWNIAFCIGYNTAAAESSDRVDAFSDGLVRAAQAVNDKSLTDFIQAVVETAKRNMPVPEVSGHVVDDDHNLVADCTPQEVKP
jgi:hypothetical protein